MAILAAPDCKTHNPLLTSALSSLLAIMIMWVLIDQGDYYHSLTVLLYCPACDCRSLQETSNLEELVFPIFSVCLSLFFLFFFVLSILLHSSGT